MQGKMQKKNPIAASEPAASAIKEESPPRPAVAQAGAESRQRAVCCFFVSADGCSRKSKCEHGYFIHRERSRCQRLANVLQERGWKRSAELRAELGVTN
jgi:hypothetical protein